MATLVYLPANFQDGFETISIAIWGRLNSYPGSTATDLSSALGFTLAQITTAVEIMVQQHLVVRRYASDGTAVYWKASQYETLMVSKLADARTWVTNNSGSDISAMATALSVHYGIAVGIAEALQAELSCKVFYT